MSKLVITPGTKKHRLLQWISERAEGATYSEIQRFICEMGGKDYNEMEWTEESNGEYFVRTYSRRYRGIWSTNLSSGKDPILKNYCAKLKFADGITRYQVRTDTRMMLDKIKNAAEYASEAFPPPKVSSLEKDFPSDEIKNNSKIVSRTILDIEPEKKTAEEIEMERYVGAVRKVAVIKREYMKLAEKKVEIEKQMLKLNKEVLELKVFVNKLFV